MTNDDRVRSGGGSCAHANTQVKADSAANLGDEMRSMVTIIIVIFQNQFKQPKRPRLPNSEWSYRKAVALRQTLASN